MLRIANVNIPENKQIFIGLTYIFGIGRATGKKILLSANVDPYKKSKDLTTSEIEKIRKIIETQYKIEGDLRTEIQGNIKRLKEIKSYRGSRHTRNLPLRGQRTKTNARTKRGKRVTVGSGRKRPAEKT